ncbi:hypothetical protein FACS1894139_05160 [Planctomycetales bacterium]|nr:hypothetical protein FACS1894107_03100 [Planctomycetales bacterium]GHS97097.1 hypothetical protein FACS1894108_02900 [Planctomycetales bacterium]GHT03888.1 hypothetical protein FACS1894139_05160 [Planctomycetales bacterium]
MKNLITVLAFALILIGADFAAENPVYQQADQLAAARNYADAIALLKKELSPDPRNANKENAATLYRLGNFSRLAGQEDAAQNFWQQAYAAYPLTAAGRLSALALGDAAYARFAGATPNFDEWEKIRNFYSDALGMDGARFLDAATIARLFERLNRLNDRLVFDPNTQVAGAEFYRVQSGDNLTRIAKKLGLDTWYSLAAINPVNPQNLRVGQKLKAVTGRVFILINKRNFSLAWYLDGVFIRGYRCALGAPESETPPGRYKIVRMEVNPDWTDPNGQTFKFGEPGHLIGSRWLAMEGEGTNGLGIHGTVDPDSIGTKVSNGCIRLRKKDVEELYGFVSIQPGHESEVLVVE